jgi:hypothetical protein
MPRGFLSRNKRRTLIAISFLKVFEGTAQSARRFRCPHCSPEHHPECPDGFGNRQLDGFVSAASA